MVRTQTGIILSIICATSFVLIVEKRGSFVPYISFIAGLLGIFWGRGRGAFVSLLITICIYMLMNLRRIGHYMVSILVSGALLAGALTFNPQVEAVYNKWLNRWNLSGGQTLDNGRIRAWSAATEQIEKEPFGVGRWTLTVQKGSFRFYTHNDYLGFAISYGILAGVAYALVMIYAFLSLYRASKKNADPSERVIAGATLSAVCCLAINSLTDHLIADSGRYFLAWFIVAVGCSIADKRCRRIAENYT
jgi:O-antigen ligase